jgi:hypothetical protein
MAAFTSFGSTLKVGALNAGAYQAPTLAVGEILSMNVDGMTLNPVEITTITDRFRKFTPGLIDSGSISLEVNLDPDDAQQATIIDQLDASAGTTAPVNLSWLVEFGSSTNKGATMSGIGMVTAMSVKGSLDAAVTASITIKWSGAVTFTDVD